MPSGLPNLKLENFTLSVNQSQLSELVKQAVQEANPEFTVTGVTFEIDRGYEGDYRDAGRKPSITKVEVALARKR